MDKQNLKNLAKTFKDLNVQLLGFLLVAIGFIFTSDTVMTDAGLFFATSGMSVTIFLWIISLIQFFAAEFSQPETIQTKKSIFEPLNLGKITFGLGLMVLSAALTYLTAYIAVVFQMKIAIFQIDPMVIAALPTLLVAVGVGWFYYHYIKILSSTNARKKPQNE